MEHAQHILLPGKPHLGFVVQTRWPAYARLIQSLQQLAAVKSDMPVIADGINAGVSAISVASRPYCHRIAHFEIVAYYTRPPSCYLKSGGHAEPLYALHVSTHWGIEVGTLGLGYAARTHCVLDVLFVVEAEGGSPHAQERLVMLV